MLQRLWLFLIPSHDHEGVIAKSCWPSTNWLGLLTLKMGSLQEHFALSAGLRRVGDGF
jgi:hypothetical protein